MGFVPPVAVASPDCVACCKPLRSAPTLLSTTLPLESVVLSESLPPSGLGIKVQTEFTVIDLSILAEQPDTVLVYRMVAVPPLTPVTSPEEAFTVANPSSNDDHVPLAVALESVIDLPAQVVPSPVMASGGEGKGFTVTCDTLLVTVPQPAVTFT